MRLSASLRRGDHRILVRTGQPDDGICVSFVGAGLKPGPTLTFKIKKKRRDGGQFHLPVPPDGNARPHQALVDFRWQPVVRSARNPVEINEGGMAMVVLIRSRPQGLTSADYDRIAPPLVETLKQQAGFVLHVAYEDPQGFVVGEVWESQEQHDAWSTRTSCRTSRWRSNWIIQLHAVEHPA